MKKTLRTLIVGGLVAGSLAGSAGSVFARDYWHWSERERRWDYRADVRSDQRDLAREPRQLESHRAPPARTARPARQHEYDPAHHASRRTIALDLERIRAIENELREDRRAFYRR